MASYPGRKDPRIALLRRNQTSVVCRYEINPPKGVGEGVGIRTTGRGLGAASSQGTTETPGKEEEDYDFEGLGSRERILSFQQLG